MNALRTTFALLALCWLGAGCSDQPAVPSGVNGDPDRGKLLLRQYGCGTCHTIPGVPSARGNVGPPLEGISKRVYLGGVITNTPGNMIRWIRTPEQVDPRTAMPNLQVSEAHAQDMIAYLYRLK